MGHTSKLLCCGQLRLISEQMLRPLIKRMLPWLVLVVLMLGLNGGSSSNVDVNIKVNGGSNQSRLQLDCPEYNVWIETGELTPNMRDIPDWRTCGRLCGNYTVCSFWSWEKKAKVCALKFFTGDLEYRANVSYVSGDYRCQ